jgi:Uma2 family endonuclease
MTAMPAFHQPMTVEEFLVWDDGRYELVEGVPRLMAPHSDAHGTIQSNLIALVRNHLAALGGPCRPVTEGGVKPRIRSRYNYRKPDLAVTCTPNRAGEVFVPEPVLLVEVLSTNEDETRDNIARYTSMESVREIVLFHADHRLAEVWRRGDGGWPDDPELADEEMMLETIGLRLNFSEVYRWVDLPEDGITARLGGKQP